MNWYIKQIFAQSTGLQSYLETLGTTPDIIQYILSLDKNQSQILTNEVRKNPSLTLQQLQQIQMPQKENPYTPHEINTANPYPEPMKTWILVNIRKLRTRLEWVPESERMKIHNFHMYFINNLPQILDWVERSDPTPDISSYTPEQAIEASDDWHRMMAGKGEGKGYEPTIQELIVYGPQWSNPEWEGWTIQKVMSENDLLAEGNKMNHCVGGFCDAVERENSVIYSLRDPKNEPHVTIEIGGEKSDNPGNIEQLQGNSNKEPSEKYKPMIKEWISTSSAEQGINKEIDAFESLEEEYGYESPDISRMTSTIDKILQGESNEYGLNYIFDSDLTTIMTEIAEIGEATNQNNQYDDYYRGEITEAPPYIVNLALKEDLGLQRWPSHSGEYKEMILNNPKQTDWKHIREVEKWAWKEIDKVQEDFYNYETGLDYPQEESYESQEEYQADMNEFEEAEAEVHDEWLSKSTKGGFAKDMLDEIKSYREQGVIPSSQELFDMDKKKQEQKVLEKMETIE